jgi:hypothetical protein
MISDLSAVRKGIVANLSAVFPFQVSPYMLSNPTPPALYVVPNGIDFDASMQRGYDRLYFLVRLVVANNLDVPSQSALDDMCSPVGATSVKTALESDVSLGGAVSYARVAKVSAPHLLVTPGSPDALAVDFTVDVVG